MADFVTPIRDSIMVFTEGARTNFKIFGHLLPVFALNLDGEPQIWGVPWQSPDEKEAFAQHIQNLIGQGRVTEVLMVVEAWAAHSDLGEAQKWLAQHGSLENFPGRREIVTVTYCSPREEIEYTTEIDRSTIPALLGEWEVHERYEGDLAVSQEQKKARGFANKASSSCSPPSASQTSAPSATDALEKLAAAEGRVKVIHGSNDEIFDNLVGQKVSTVRASLVDAFNIPGDALAFVNGEQVDGSYVLQKNETLESSRRA